MAGRFVVLRAAGKSSDSLPGCSTFAGWWCDMNIMPKISKVSFIWQPLLSCCAIYEMASSDHSVILGIPLCERSTLPFWICVKLTANDCPAVELHCQITAEQVGAGEA